MFLYFRRKFCVCNNGASWILSSELSSLNSGLKIQKLLAKRLQKFPRKINVSLSLAKRKLAEKNEWKLSNQLGEVMHDSIYLTNRRRSFFFSVTLFRAWFYDSQFSKIKFSCSENIGDVPGTCPWWSAMLVKLHAFIPQFNQFHPVCSYHITSLDDYLWIYVWCHTGETTYLSCMIKYVYFMHQNTLNLQL